MEGHKIISTSETPNSEINEVAEKLFNESQKSQVMNTYCPRCKEVYSKNKVDSKNIPREWIKRDVAICDLAEELEKELTATKAEIPDGYKLAADTLPEQIKLMHAGLTAFHKNGEALEQSRDAWKKMAGDIMDQLDSWSNLHPNHVTSGDVEVKAAYEKLLKEDT